MVMLACISQLLWDADGRVDTHGRMLIGIYIFRLSRNESRVRVVASGQIIVDWFVCVYFGGR